jgi:ribosomal protein S13
MLKQEDIKRIAALLHVKDADLVDAIKSEEEKEIALPEGLTTYTDEELTTLKGNEYKAGKKAGEEMAVKEVKEKHGLDFQGKTIEGLLEAAKKKVLEDAQIEPTKKVQELEDKLKTVQNTVKEYETKLSEKDSEVTAVKINTELYKHIPAPGENGPALGADDVIQLMKISGYEFRLENGATIAYKNGQPVQDKVANPLPINEVIGSFLKEKKLVTDPVQPGGRGGKDQRPPSTPMKLSELKKQFQDQNKSLIGQEFAEAAQKLAKEVEGFKMDE